MMFNLTSVARETDKSHHDPIELCKLLAKSMGSSEINIADKNGSTPLHLAACRGASICCMYLLQVSGLIGG